VNNLLTVLRSLIAASGTGSGFAATFAGRVYLDTAPADVSLPCCVYTATQNRYERTFDGTMESVLVTFEMASETSNPNDLTTASARLQSLLDNTDSSGTGYARVVFLLRQRGAPVFADDIWTVTDVYEMIGLRKT
jgi:hypothetical protein